MEVNRNSKFLIIILLYLKVHICESQDSKYNLSQLNFDTCQKYNNYLYYENKKSFVVNKKSRKIAANEKLHLKFYVLAPFNSFICLSTVPGCNTKEPYYAILIEREKESHFGIKLFTNDGYKTSGTLNSFNDSGVELALIEIIQKKDGLLLVSSNDFSDERFLKFFDSKTFEINYVSLNHHGQAPTWFHSCNFDGFGDQTIGNCTDLKNCICNAGYYKTFENICEPVCEGGCINGECIAPNRCTCNAGYSLSDNNICEPVCEGGCVNGECIAPNRCTCNAGYSLSDNNICKPVCEGGCRNGNCVGPNTCECYSRYYKTFENLCEPVCRGGCINGVCIAPDNCTCNERYVLSKTDKNKCNPVCKINCSNGICSAPDKCVCNFLYTWSNEKRQCVLY